MRVIADLQIHSRHARATSKNITLENLEKYARIKGLDLLGTGDFQHPLWNKEVKEKLKEDDKGILWTENKFPFLWQTEVSLIFSQGGKRRAVHILIFAPNRETADKIIAFLGSKGRLDYDGRPIFGMTCKYLVSELKKIDDKIEIIPAHCLLSNEKVICKSDIKPISEIIIGDMILTHTSSYKKVVNTFNRNYHGKIFRIQPYYFSEGINVTPEHPLLAIKTVKDCSAIRGLCKPNSISKGKHVCKIRHYEKYKANWIMAKNLEVNDVLLYPRCTKVQDHLSFKISNILIKDNYKVKGNYIYPISGRQDIGINNIINITPEFCRLIGYYLAEGYPIKKNNCLQFSFAKHEKYYIDEVVRLMKHCFNVKLTKKRERNGYELYFYSKVIVDLFSTLFYKKNKELKAPFKMMPQWMLYLPLFKQIELFRGWWRGDAGSTTSELLANQMKFICLRMRIIPSVYKLSKEKILNYNSKIKGRKINASTDIFCLQRLSFYEDKFGLLNDPEFKKFKTKLERKHGWIDDNFIYIPIKEINTTYYKGKVYNLEVEKNNSYVTPAAIVHNCFTPWFGMYGSQSGFDSLAECFEEEAKHIYAIESGMSADPAMIWRLKEKINIVSFSDAHSFWPFRLGREATILEIPEISYENIMKAIRTGEGLAGTIETPPEYGKYHYDGHRNCNFSCSPGETEKINGVCPICNKELIIGVENRINKIAKEQAGYKPENARHYHSILPLHELIALAYGIKMESKKAWEIYNSLIEQFGNEFNILLNVSKEDLVLKKVNSVLIDLVFLGREGKLKVKPGYDGEYGVVMMPEKQARLV